MSVKTKDKSWLGREDRSASLTEERERGGRDLKKKKSEKGGDDMSGWRS